MRRRVIFTVILLVIAITGLMAGYLAFNARNASLDLSTRVISEEEFIEQGSEIIPFGNPPSNLMFSSDIKGDWDVMLLEVDGTLNNLTADDSGGQDILASFYITGDVINFVSNRLDADALGPVQVNPDGRNLETLTIVSAVMSLLQESKFDWDPTWSPDGETLAWVSLRDANLEIYTIALSDEIDFSSADRRTRDLTRDWFIAWSPDGSQIVYNNNNGGTENVYLLDLASDESTQLTESDSGDYMHPFWSLEGDALFFVQETEGLYSDGILEIMQMNPDGTDLRPLDGVVRADPVWSPGASHVAFMSNAGGNWHIYVMRADGTNLRRVTEGSANHMFPVWMP